MTNDSWAAPVDALLQIDGHWWRFTDGARVVVAHRPEDVPAAVTEVERAVDGKGLFAAGYLAYEAAGGYGLSVHAPQGDGPPPAWFGLFRRRELVEPPAVDGDFAFGPWLPSLDYDTYAVAIERIKAAIARGDTYQANYTFHLRAGFTGEPAALFAALSAAQRARYCAYLDLGRFVICSASPELFLRRRGARVESRPMKGTAPRGLTLAQDRAQIDWLRASEKNRAENVMIVDMLRNDLGRVARVGSVRVPALFAVERYPTLLQMTSTVTAESDASLVDLLAAVFPCASITGAPKVRTMRLLRELERGPRGVYTGAIGAILPGEAQFNVAIRTAVIDRARGTATYGVGSGIVWDSDAAAEYDECLLKARVLSARPADARPFHLLESLLWTPGEDYFLRERHLRRLAESAEYFTYPVDMVAAERCLNDLAATLAAPAKVRLLVGPDGRCTAEAYPLGDAPPEPLRVGLAAAPVSSADVWLYHKTTRRASYDAARASRPDCDEVILWNERGELTEATASNIVLEHEGREVTPPVSSGLLAGTLRAHLLETGAIAEHVLTKDDLGRATRLWLINSVRGRRAARLV